MCLCVVHFLCSLFYCEDGRKKNIVAYARLHNATCSRIMRIMKYVCCFFFSIIFIEASFIVLYQSQRSAHMLISFTCLLALIEAVGRVYFCTRFRLFTSLGILFEDKSYDKQQQQQQNEEKK